jgi:Na+-transporting NADH:ubiquinone oxidoreductase subunit F
MNQLPNVVDEGRIGNVPVEVTINGLHKETVAGGIPLLTALKDKGIMIPSVCGGRGACGRCRLTVLEGGGEPTPQELRKLTEAELKAGGRLACQLVVRRPISIRIPEEVLRIRRFRTQVASIRDLTYDIKEVRLRLLEPDRIEFAAGQYIQLETPPGDPAGKPVCRAFSLASPPSAAGEIELEIRYVPNGICTTYVHKRLKVGDIATITGPYGEFGLRGGDDEIVCIAGGSGMAPIKSLLLDMRDRSIRRPTRYFFGARARRDLFLVAEMHALESVLPDFRFIPALSEPQPGDDWRGETGLITEVVDRHLTSGAACQAYLCGSPLMVDACIRILHAKGIGDDRIFYDKYA